MQSFAIENAEGWTGCSMKIKRILDNNLFMLRRVFWYCPKYAVITILSAVLTSSQAVLNVYFLKAIVDIGGTLENIESAVWLIIAFATINIFIKTSLSFIVTYFSPRYMQLIQKGLQEELLNKASAVSFDYTDNASYYDKFTIALQQADARLVALINTLSNIITSLIGISTFSVIVISLEKTLLMYVLVALVIAIFFDLYTAKTSYTYAIKSIPVQRKMEYSKRVVYLREFSQDLHLNRTIINLILQRFENAVGDAITLIHKYGIRIGVMQSLIAIVPTLLQAASMFYSIRGMMNGLFSIGEVILISNSCISLFNQLNIFSTSLYQLYEHSLYIENYKEFMEFTCEEEQFGSRAVPNIIDIKFKDVSFTYCSGNKRVLNNLNFEIMQGEKIILLGSNGTGKSTLVKLLCGLYVPTEGTVLLNDITIEKYDINQYRSLCHLVPQSVSLFAASIAENILMRPFHGERDEQIIWFALRQVEMDQKVQELPNGIFSELTREFDENGVLFSGGELQRIALARVFAGNYALIILDEATSQVDKYTEAHIYQRLFEQKRSSTIITITHRPDNIMNADKLYILNEQGGIKCERCRS